MTSEQHQFTAQGRTFPVILVRKKVKNINLHVRRVWPDLPNHKLDTVAGHLGYSFHHHQALDDARACAYIVLKAAEIVGASSMEELLKDRKSVV